MYAWFVKHQDVISGFVSGIALMTAADYFAQGNVTYGCLNLFISAANLLLSGKKIGQHGQSN
jgi:uncharacterized membrane-anchored protein YitT (DUF2179 family)